MTATQDPEIVSEAFGNPADPSVLLIMGAMASMLWWPGPFCRQLAGEGRFVIRYDNRDTGLSTNYTPGKPPYGFEDMVDDAMRVLDDRGIARAHGGTIWMETTPGGGSTLVLTLPTASSPQAVPSKPGTAAR